MTAPAERLPVLRDEVLADLTDLDARITAVADARDGANTDDEHDPEGATIAFEQAQAAALRSAALRRLAEIDAALTRVADATYGRCVRCGEPIPAARLEARPTAATCVRHG